MKTSIASLMLAGALAAVPALATAAPVEGTVTIDGQTIRITHAAAQLNDNAEKIEVQPLTLVFADRPIPAGAIDGGGWTLMRMAADGELRGLLLRIDPAAPQKASMVLLAKRGDGQPGIVSASASSAEGPVVQGFKLDASTVSGAFVRKDYADMQLSLSHSVRFAILLTHAPAISADLGAAQLKASVQYKALASLADAMQRGDLVTARRLHGTLARAELDAASAATDRASFVERMKKQGAYMKTQLPRYQRLVVRGNRATFIVAPDYYQTMSLEDGEWKMGS